jgi:hypothetical protein
MRTAIIATIDVSSVVIYGHSSTTVTGNTIRTDLPVLGFAPGPVFTTQQFANFGPLPQGTYTYQVYEVFQGQSALLSQQVIVVVPPAGNEYHSIVSSGSISGSDRVLRACEEGLARATWFLPNGSDVIVNKAALRGNTILICNRPDIGNDPCKV